VKTLSDSTRRPPKTYRLHALDSPEAEAVLARQGMTRARLKQALAELARAGGADVRTIIGVNSDGVFGTGREGWDPHLPDAFKEPVIAVPWGRMLELSGGAVDDHLAV
jgi:hypothetical protein